MKRAVLLFIQIMILITSTYKHLAVLCVFVDVSCVLSRDYRAGSQGGDGSRDREYPLSRQKSEEGSLPNSRYNSRPPTRSGSRPSTADSLRHSIGVCLHLPNLTIFKYF